VEFLEAIHRLAPEVLLDLRSSVLPEFQTIYRFPLIDLTASDYVAFLRDRGLEDEFIYPWLVPQSFVLPPGSIGSARMIEAWPTIQAAAEGPCPYLMPTVEKLVSWAERSFLTRVEVPSGLRSAPEWVLNAGWGTIVAWHAHPNLRDAMDWHPPSLILPPIPALELERVRFSFRYERYNPLNQIWKDFERNFRSDLSTAVNSFLKKYKRAVEKDFVNWKRTPNKWQKQHFDWFVLYQIKGYSPGQIAVENKSPITEIAVLKAVHRVAGLLGLTPRTGKRGRRSLASPRAGL
jgi:hypothetical protein